MEKRNPHVVISVSKLFQVTTDSLTFLLSFAWEALSLLPSIGTYFLVILVSSGVNWIPCKTYYNKRRKLLIKF